MLSQDGSTTYSTRGISCNPVHLQNGVSVISYLRSYNLTIMASCYALLDAVVVTAKAIGVAWSFRSGAEQDRGFDALLFSRDENDLPLLSWWQPKAHANDQHKAKHVLYPRRRHRAQRTRPSLFPSFLVVLPLYDGSRTNILVHIKLKPGFPSCS